MIDASWARTVVEVAVIALVVLCARRRVTADQRRDSADQEKQMEEVRRLIKAGQREVLTEVSTLIDLTRIQVELQYCGSPAVREPAADPDQAIKERISAIVAEIRDSPYMPDQVRSDLPEEIGELAVLHRDGPVIVHGPTPHQPRRYGRTTLNGLAAVPLVGALIRSVTACAQGTAALSSATFGATAAATIALAPAPPAAAQERPPVVAVTRPGQDTHLQRAPAQIGQAASALAPSLADAAPAAPLLRKRPRQVRPPRVETPAPVAPAPDDPDPAPSPTQAPSPAPTLTDAPASEAPATDSATPAPTERTAPTVDTTVAAATEPAA